MTKRRLALVVLAVAGVLLAHTIGDAFAHGDGSPPGHGYVLPALATLAPIAVLLAAAAAVGEARRAGLALQLSVARLLVTQVVIFAALEIGERLWLGHLGSIISEPGVVFGLTAQVPVAVMLCRLVGLARRVAIRLFGSLPHGVPRSARPSPPSPAPNPSRRLWTPVSSRAPPLFRLSR